MTREGQKKICQDDVLPGTLLVRQQSTGSGITFDCFLVLKVYRDDSYSDDTDDDILWFSLYDVARCSTYNVLSQLFRSHDGLWEIE